MNSAKALDKSSMVTSPPTRKRISSSRMPRIVYPKVNASFRDIPRVTPVNQCHLVVQTGATSPVAPRFPTPLTGSSATATDRSRSVGHRLSRACESHG